MSLLSKADTRPGFQGGRRSYRTALRCLYLVFTSSRRRAFNGARFLLATEGDSFERSLAAFRASPDGPRLLQTRPDSFAVLRDRDTQRQSPAGSLGECYYRFMTGNGFNENLYAKINAFTLAEWYDGDPERAWYRTRLECGHDLRHVLIGYGSDLLGELCLLCFRFGQLRHVGMVVIAAFGILHPTLRPKSRVLRILREAYRRGRSAMLVDLLTWEEAMHVPLATVRARLGLSAPEHYEGQLEPDLYGETANGVSPR